MRAASVSTAMSAISSWISWNCASCLPNCVRSEAYATDASTHACATPTAPAASEIRPLSSADIATLNPAPSSPSRAESGTRTPSKKSSAVSCARRPSLPSIFRALKPGESVGTRKHVMPARPLAARPREDERDPGPRAERDEDLRAVDHPLVAVTHRARHERRRIGARARLRQPVAPERLARRHARQPLLPAARPSPTSRSSCRRGRC